METFRCYFYEIYDKFEYFLIWKYQTRIKHFALFSIYFYHWFLEMNTVSETRVVRHNTKTTLTYPPS